MYWLSSPPYVRWLIAATIVITAAFMDLSGPSTVSYPFVAEDATAGDTIVVEWRQVPAGLLPTTDAASGMAHRDLVAGTPLVPGLVAPTGPIPADWWAIPTELPLDIAPGAEVLVTMRDPDLEVAGIVVSRGSEGSFGVVTQGVIAVPPQDAATVAAALAESRATVLFRP